MDELVIEELMEVSGRVKDLSCEDESCRECSRMEEAVGLWKFHRMMEKRVERE